MGRPEGMRSGEERAAAGAAAQREAAGSAAERPAGLGVAARPGALERAETEEARAVGARAVVQAGARAAEEMVEASVVARVVEGLEAVKAVAVTVAGLGVARGWAAAQVETGAAAEPQVGRVAGAAPKAAPPGSSSTRGSPWRVARCSVHTRNGTACMWVPVR